jgi:hypothetical protein
MRKRSNSTAFRSVTPLTPRINGSDYVAFARYRPIPDFTPFVPPEEQCTIDDPIDSLIYDSLPGSTTVTEVDQYGLLGFVNRRQASPFVSELNWTICPNNDYCDGPEIEGSVQANRYTTRWQAVYDPDTGIIQYGRTDGTLVNADSALFPVPLTLTKEDQISLSFDANARASYAIQASASTIEIRRFVAGVPTTHTFTGISPRLLYNGILQRDNSLVDLVCFYINAGAICGRFQRDNFGVEYVFYTPPTSIAPTRISKTDRDISYQELFYHAGEETYYALRSSVYPPFPIYVSEPLGLSIVAAGGDYFSVVIDGGAYTENTTLSIGPAGGSYNSNTITVPLVSEQTTLQIYPNGGEYTQITVSGGTYAESASLQIAPGDGNYVETSVNGGTYTENTTLTIGPAGGTYA